MRPCLLTPVALLPPLQIRVGDPSMSEEDDLRAALKLANPFVWCAVELEQRLRAQGGTNKVRCGNPLPLTLCGRRGRRSAQDNLGCSGACRQHGCVCVQLACRGSSLPRRGQGKRDPAYAQHPPWPGWL